MRIGSKHARGAALCATVAGMMALLLAAGCEYYRDERERTYYRGTLTWTSPGETKTINQSMFVDAFDRVWPGVYPIPRGHDEPKWQRTGDPDYWISTEGGPKGFTIVIHEHVQVMTYKGSVSGKVMSGTFHVDTVNAGSGDGTFRCVKDD